MQVITDLKNLGSATVFNAIVDLFGGLDVKTDLNFFTGPEIRCLLPDLGAAAGFAVTCELTSSDPDDFSEPWGDYYQILSQTKGPILSVIKDVSRSNGRGASFGDEMAATHKRFGVDGVLVDGSIRDLTGIHDQGLPVWAKGLVPGHGFFNLKAFNRSVNVEGLDIEPGDLLILDIDGAVKIPSGINSEDVVRKGFEIMEREKKYRESVRNLDSAGKLVWKHLDQKLEIGWTEKLC